MKHKELKKKIRKLKKKSVKNGLIREYSPGKSAQEQQSADKPNELRPITEKK